MTIYLDNAATSFPKPESVYQAIEYGYREIGVGPGRGGYRRGLEANRLIFETRELLATLFGISDSSRIILTHNATEALNLAISGLLRPGDHVVTTSMEHNSVVRPLYLAENGGITVTKVAADSRGLINPSAVGAALTPATRLVVVNHCSNVTGTIQPIDEIATLAKSVGAYFLVDAAQSAGSIPIDVRETGIDLLAAPGHKGLFGPLGTGFLYLADGIELAPIIVGGTGGYSTSPAQPEALPERYESGTLNTPAIAGLKAGIEFIVHQGLEVIRAKEATHVEHLLHGLVKLPAIKVLGVREPRLQGGVVSFLVHGKDPAEIGMRLDRDHDIAVRVGLHCAPDAHKTIGTYPVGTVRVSPGFFTTENDIEVFLSALRTMV